MIRLLQLCGVKVVKYLEVLLSNFRILYYFQLLAISEIKSNR